MGKQTIRCYKITLSIVAAAAAIIAGSLLYRLQKSKPIVRAAIPTAIFSEQWRSGRSDRRWFSRAAIAPNLLWVTVAKGELHVSAHFPFSLMFIPEAFGWDHRVPVRSILDIAEGPAGFLGNPVVLRYRHATGEEEKLQLWVYDRTALVRALAAGRILPLNS